MPPAVRRTGGSMPTRSVFHCFFNRIQKFPVGLIGRNIWIFRLDLIGATEKETGFAGPDHAKIVIGVSAGNGLKADGLQSLHRRELGLLHPHFVTGDLAIFRHFKRITEQRRPAQLLHQRSGKLRKSITDKDHL